MPCDRITHRYFSRPLPPRPWRQREGPTSHFTAALLFSATASLLCHVPLERPVACGLWAVFTERRGVAPPFRRSLTGSCAATLEVLRAVWNALACASFSRVRSPSRTVSEAVGHGCVRATRCIHDAHTRTFTGGSTTTAWYDRTELPPTAAEETTSVENSVGRLVVREPRTAAPLYPFRYKQVRRLEDKLRTLEAEGIPASRVVVVGRYLRKPTVAQGTRRPGHIWAGHTVRWAASRKVAVSRCSSPTEGRRSASGPWAAHSARLLDAVINTGVFRQAPLSPASSPSLHTPVTCSWAGRLVEESVSTIVCSQTRRRLADVGGAAGAAGQAPPAALPAAWLV